MSATATDQITPALGNLPEWDLRDLYPSTDGPELTADLARAEADAKAFRDTYRGRTAKLSGKALGEAISAFEALDEVLSRIHSYADLTYAGNMADPAIGRFYQNTREKISDIASAVLFFTLEINRIADEALEKKLASPALARYRPWLRDVRAFREHELDEEMERLLHDKAVAGRAAWVRLFDETIAHLRFPVNGTEMSSAEALHLLSDADRTMRETAARAIGKVFNDNLRIFATITNTLAKDKEVEDRWRRYPRPQSARNLSNHVEDEVVDALVSAVKDAYPRLSHRYYALKARWFGLDRLAYWDRNAPLPDMAERIVPWDEARDTVLAAYGAFSPGLAEVGARFFDNRWIDAPMRPAKSPGAFAHPTVPSAHPYLLLNYQGRMRDVMTLAHELGHGVHQVLAAPRGHLMSSTPLTLAETASVFGEMLTFRRVMETEADPRRRKALLAGKVEDMINTVVRQIAFFDFESRVHGERREGEITAERLCEIWLAVQAESLGPAIALDGDYRTWWSYIPHFVHSPFYVYAYAFGDCLVNSLFAVYRGAAEGFAEKYLDMLRAGGTLRHRELLAPFGLDASDPAFWNKGLGLIGDMVDELERMD